ncbi:MAG: cell division protein FtsL [Deltaproteobacteria bacterium]|nr:cell division protein FtsL [Deltaproteobacteria bacterium]
MSAPTPLAPPRTPRLPSIDSTPRASAKPPLALTHRFAARSPARVWVPALGFMLLGVMGAALGHVWVRLQQIQTGYALSQERREARGLAETQKRLRLEAAVLKQPQRIERIARVRLGMTAPDPSKIHIVRVARTAERRPGPPASTALAHAAAPEAGP